MRKIITILILLIFFFGFNSLNAPANDPVISPYLKKLKERVKKDLKGTVPKDYIEKIFSSPKLTYFPNIMAKSLTWKEIELPYYQFLEEERIKRAKNFMAENKELLEDIEFVFGVEKEVITAIFLIETDLGRKTGRFPVINVFYSLALSGERELFEKFIDNSEISLDDEFIKKKWTRRSNWGYKELLYFIQIAYQNNWNPFSIKGSIFGAFGYPQFVPKSYLIYGYDWDKDGKVDLYNLADALASIANYLKKEGYKMEADQEYKKKIIMKYNISEPYADTVLSVAEKLKN
ncbi:MAG: Membrane-bound lytic murein transglycosylase B [Thermodesulfobacterium sp.]|uniref:Membrane-bound lytic murein transglycosylase B n=1 Tax=Candidatus Thermodesulfobacterium syntrophicum TaxID=3060442 RepID=A0AAE3P4A4_9BACT|nr:Membrane-bound lytic murein transglycosylase B [Candidatus Thermodesulfobacterium syntrophicum]